MGACRPESKTHSRHRPDRFSAAADFCRLLSLRVEAILIRSGPSVSVVRRQIFAVEPNAERVVAAERNGQVHRGQRFRFRGTGKRRLLTLVRGPKITRLFTLTVGEIVLLSRPPFTPFLPRIGLLQIQLPFPPDGRVVKPRPPVLSEGAKVMPFTEFRRGHGRRFLAEDIPIKPQTVDRRCPRAGRVCRRRPSSSQAAAVTVKIRFLWQQVAVVAESQVAEVGEQRLGPAPWPTVGRVYRRRYSRPKPRLGNRRAPGTRNFAQRLAGICSRASAPPPTRQRSGLPSPLKSTAGHGLRPRDQCESGRNSA